MFSATLVPHSAGTAERSPIGTLRSAVCGEISDGIAIGTRQFGRRPLEGNSGHATMSGCGEDHGAKRAGPWLRRGPVCPLRGRIRTMDTAGSPPPANTRSAALFGFPPADL